MPLFLNENQIQEYLNCKSIREFVNVLKKVGEENALLGADFFKVEKVSNKVNDYKNTDQNVVIPLKNLDITKYFNNSINNKLDNLSLNLNSDNEKLNKDKEVEILEINDLNSVLSFENENKTDNKNIQISNQFTSIHTKDTESNLNSIKESNFISTLSTLNSSHFQTKNSNLKIIEKNIKINEKKSKNDYSANKKIKSGKSKSINKKKNKSVKKSKEDSNSAKTKKSLSNNSKKKNTTSNNIYNEKSSNLFLEFFNKNKQVKEN
jgi:hypothetical protein